MFHDSYHRRHADSGLQYARIRPSGRWRGVRKVGEPAVSRLIENGTVRQINGKDRIYYDGYWIRYYPPPKDTLSEKKRLIDALTRRTFHHTEAGINTPGENLELAREAFEQQTDPARKRVNGAMLAGALFNRATDIFTRIVELEEKGVKISPDNELMRECSECFTEALSLAHLVRHYSGHEGVDELWGEPLKVFTLPIIEFYDSRYIKIAQTQRDIDLIADRLIGSIGSLEAFTGIEEPVREFARAARRESETMKTDPDNFEVWPEFVAAGERLAAFRYQRPRGECSRTVHHLEEANRLLDDGRNLITYLAGVRVPMPKSTREHLETLAEFSARSAELGLS